MKISEKLKLAGETVLGIFGETDVESLGLLQSNTEQPIASFLTEEKYLDNIAEKIRMVIVTQNLADEVLKTGRGVCVVENPKLSFFRLHNYLTQTDKNYTLQALKSTVGKECKISNTASIANTNVFIGDRVIIEDYVKIYENTRIEDDAIVHSGAIIGGEGFECKNDGSIVFSINHAGSVTIKKRSEIGNNTCIDKALYPWDSTVISEYCVLDNLVHIGHGVKIGKRNLIAAGSVVAGRTETGQDIWIGLGSLISNGLHIGDNSKIDIGSVVIKDVKENTEVFGNPARTIKKL